MRVKKLYNITEQTITCIQRIAEENDINESYALDNIVQNYYRMTHKNQGLPLINVKKQIHRKKEKTQDINEFIENNKDTLTQKQIEQLRKS